MTFGSLFAGIGGLDLGLERAGMECKWQVEIDEYARRVLAKHWPNVRKWEDIKTFPPDADNDKRGRGEKWKKTRNGKPRIYGKAWHVDLICGGFPCQDISTAGKRAGLHGDRSGLFFEAIRVVELLRPRWLLLENVAGLLARGLDEVLATLAEVGFDAEWHCLQAADFGAPHIRDRVFIIAERATPEKSTDANEPRLQRIVRQGTTAKKRKPDGYATECDWWAAEPDVGRVAHGIPARVDRLKGLGNAVVPQIAEWLGRQIMKGDNNYD